MGTGSTVTIIRSPVVLSVRHAMFSSDYYMVASARFVNTTIWSNVTGVAILHYSNSKGKAKGPLPDGPDDYYDKYFSMNQARSIRWNVSAGAARPNPQGSFKYGSDQCHSGLCVEKQATRVDQWETTLHFEWDLLPSSCNST
jgi:hypothetical protein